MNPFDLRATWGPLAARLYDVVVAGQGTLYAEILARTVPGPLEGAVLDVGAGPGHVGVMLAVAHPAIRLVGIDSSPEMVRLANARAERAGARNASFAVADALALPYPADRFDLVLSIASIKHWSDPGAGLAEMHRVLKPGGRMVVVEADRGARGEVVTAYARRWRWLPAPLAAPYFRLFIGGQSLDPVDAEALLRASPFRDHEVERLSDMPLFTMRARKA